MRLDVKLPKVLSLEEIEKLINSATQIRNKAIIALLYSSGMRVGELVSLKPEDIYMSTMQVYISKGKNHRDRWTILSERALDLLKEYCRRYPVNVQSVKIGVQSREKGSYQKMVSCFFSVLTPTVHVSICTIKFWFYCRLNILCLNALILTP